MRTKDRKNPGSVERKGEARAATQVLPGRPDGSETACLKRAGVLQSVSDLLWIAQAALIAWSLGQVLVAIEASRTDGFESFPVSALPTTAIAGIVLVALARVYLQNRSLNLARRTARQIQQKARAGVLSAAIARSPAASFPSSGAFASQVTEQIDLLGPYYRNFVPQQMRLKLVPLGILVATACFSWLATLILLICGPLIPLFMALIGMRAKAASKGQQEELTRLSGVLLDRIKGLETLTVFGALDRTRADIAAAGETFRRGTMSVLKIAFLSSTVLELFSALGIAFCAVYVGFSLLGDIETGTWGAPLNYSAGLFVLLLAPEFFAPLRAYAAAYHDRAAGLAAQEKLFELMQEIGGDSSPAISATVVSGRNDELFLTPPAIRFNSVALKLAGRPVFDGLDLTISAGETVLLNGRSGSGKTALMDCILGFHEPFGGKITVGDRPLEDVLVRLRRNVLWLDQTPRLFHGSLKANLLKGASDPATVSDADLWDALRMAGAEKLVQRLPRGLATQLGEGGFGLSVGEIRRVALARAAMRREAMILLADEPTAGLDDETAADVVRGLKKLAQNRTAVIATHDRAVLGIGTRVVDFSERHEAIRERVTA